MLGYILQMLFSYRGSGFLFVAVLSWTVRDQHVNA